MHKRAHWIGIGGTVAALVLLVGVWALADHVRDLQMAAVKAKKADWGHWGVKTDAYSSWTSHSSRLIPIYTFGIGLEDFKGAKSIYRDEARLKALYGRLPDHTLNPEAEYLDQTDVYRLQKKAAELGKKHIILFIFDGMDWQTTWAAAIQKTGTIPYREGRGTGLYFQDYRGVSTDFGYFVTSPANDGTKVDASVQVVTHAGGKTNGGFDWKLGGNTPWSIGTDPTYLIGKDKARPHAYTDSAASATSMNSGIKTYNASINVDVNGTPVEPISRQLQAQGYAIGVVTSVPISHATPACAYANNVHRDDYQDITRDLVGLVSVAHRSHALPGVDVLLGDGWGSNLPKDNAGNRGRGRGRGRFGRRGNSAASESKPADEKKADDKKADEKTDEEKAKSCDVEDENDANNAEGADDKKKAEGKQDGDKKDDAKDKADDKAKSDKDKKPAEKKDPRFGQGDNFVPGNAYITADDLKRIELANGGKYRVVQRQAGVNGGASLARAAAEAAEHHDRLFGFFGCKVGHLPFQTADGKFDPTDNGAPKTNEGARTEKYTPADIEENPTLADFARAALTVLEKRDRFWLMIEAGDVDWANHANNLDNSIGAVKSGDDAFRAVIQWVEARHAWNDTAVIVTSDHGHYLFLDHPEAILAWPIAPTATAEKTAATKDAAATEDKKEDAAR